MNPTTAAKITFQGKPAKKTTNNPDAMIKVAVPKSGCFKINAPGTMTRARATK